MVNLHVRETPPWDFIGSVIGSLPGKLNRMGEPEHDLDG
jgi:hypothetical protein